MLICKVGDIAIGTCVCTPTPYPDVGVISSGDSMMIDAGAPVGRIGDIVVFSCGSSVIAGGSSLEISCGPGLARMGDPVMGCGIGTIVASSINIGT